MIYNYVTTPTQARDDMRSFYEDVLMDELRDSAELTTPQAYLADVRNDAKNQSDYFGHDIEKLILKACDQPSTLRALAREYDEAKADPEHYIFMRT